MKASKPSKLEIYVEILRSLDMLKAANLRVVQEKTNIEQTVLKHAVIFLEKQALIKKETTQNEVVYTNTSRGERVSRYFSQQHKEIPGKLPYAIPSDIV
jgi:predicted transcriptional regulator